MESTNYILQTATKAAFENIIWSRPERTSAAGKLLIIGGHESSFKSSQQAYVAAQECGAGQVKICLPKSLEKIIGDQPGIEYVPQTPSGSIAEAALNELNSYCRWGDGLLLPGDLSGNSETELCLASLLASQTFPIVVAGDAKQLLWRNLSDLPASKVTVVCEYKQLQKLIVEQSLPVLIKRDDSIATVRANLLQLHQLTSLQFIVAWEQQVFAVAAEQVSQTDAKFSPQVTACAAVLQMQFKQQPFEALTSAVYLSVSDK